MADSQSDSNVFSVRIVSIDYYMAPPIPGFDICYSSFQGGKVNEVPVIRVYGSTPAGQKTCMHIHGALPYFYIPYEDLLQPHQEGDASGHFLSLAIEKALKLKGNAGLKRQHVHDCSLVRAKKFYGYHSSEELFAKIHLYYPHDVPRAANLLLGGAVLDKSLQPHESHIPFLLQFLVDFNLYGMGHIHVSSLKFRHPVPNVFSGSKANYNEQHAQGTDISSCMAAGFQADSSDDTCFGSPVWISSTIPHGWMWQPPSQPDASSDPNFHLFKRQSTCELEGDITVDEILNQQLKLYSSLSQTLSDVKMVRSLIPIWEEERERTGIYDAAIPPDPGKPLPQDVLRALSHGLGFENKLRQLCSEAEDDYCDTPFEKDAGFSQSTRSSVGEGNEDEIGIIHPKSNCGETSKRLKLSPETGFMLPQGLPFEGDDRNICGEGRDVCLKQLSAEEMRTSDTTGTANQKVAEKEALGLLRWLASSQAADDINSDDELVRETILSPLLPATTIDKVLEKANMDYESESQQECQDILDSIEDSINFEVLNEKAIDNNYSCQTSSEKTIPQIDGSSDDLNLFPNAGESSKAEMKSKFERLSQDQVQKETDASFTGKHEKNKPLWGSLPFSSVKKVNDDLHHVSINMTGRCGSQTMEGTSNMLCQAENEAEKCLDAPVSSLDRDVGDSKEASTLVGCSVRELMRRKRSYRVELPESETRSVKKNPLEEEQKEDLYSSKFNSDVPTNNERLHQRDPIDANCLSTFPIESEILNKDGYVCQSGVDSRMCVHSIPEMSSKNLEGTEAETSKTVVQSKNCVGGQDVTYTCLSGAGSSTSSIFYTESNPPEHICMTFHKKPPKVDLANQILEDPSFALAKDRTFHGDEDNYERISGQGTVGDRFLPFFADDGQEVREFQKSCRNSDFEHCQQAVLGIPTHYQNDGSYLYLLTPVFSPPSAQSLSRWLLHDDRGILGEKVIAAKAEPSSPEVSCGMGVGSQSSLSDVCEKPSQESGSISLAEQKVDQPSEQAHLNYNAQVSLSNEVTTIFQHRGKVVEAKKCSGHSQDISQISGPDRKLKPTPLSQIGFRDPASVGGGQQLTLLSIEVQAESRGDLRPDPRFDAINVIVLAIQEDKDCLFDVYVILRSETETIKRNIDGISSCKVLVTHEEKHLFNHFIDIIGSFDPDILMGWDIQGGSLGFLAERALHLGISLLNNISRTPSEMKVASRDPDVVDTGMIADSVQCEDLIIEDEWGRTHASGVHVGGRVVLNIWRLMRGELKLNMYTVESVAEAVLRQKVPFIPFKILAKWFSSGPGRARHRCIEYVVKRAKLNLEIMNQLDMINRTSELARIFGIDFFSVLSRGSQYRVESMFLRLAHTQNYLAISPGSQQVASQPAMECLPLVMEPESGFYADPVIVLDFQSLYPSMIIAYNLCFCTCLGNITPSKANTLGVSFFSPDAHVFRDLKDEMLLTPNGVMYVNSKVREGILPRLLEEILSTRIMVKQAMKKLAPSQQVLHRIFNARQLALKLIANVTYGYTAAGFSGRMPCAELADSIVQCGRRTLENAISFVNSHEKWQARVIYGDTDSLFVLLKGRTKREAFQIGQEIASAITAMNPNPVTLKMEKVYSPCFLLTKKRYVGYSYESPDQIKPVFDAKGIETVRRDTCGAVAKTMEQSLRLFFEHQDVNKVKEYLQRQWTRILSGRVSLQDFVFAKEVRLGTYSTRASSSLPPAAIVASKAMRADPRAEPRYGERIPYVVVHGEPGSRLVDMVVDPLELLAIDSPFRLNGLYYISKQIIPALQRVVGLLGADLSHWFSEMPRPGRKAVAKSHTYASHSHRTRIDYYYLSKHCIMCGELVESVESSAHVCSKCMKNEASVATAVIGRTSKLEREIQHLVAICRHCDGGDWLMESGVKCTSLACSVFYERRKVQKELQSLSSIAVEAGLYPRCMVEWF